jgi:hypothetical protein
MSRHDDRQHRGDAAWKAAKAAVAQRNDAARARGGEGAGGDGAASIARRKAADEREREDLPAVVSGGSMPSPLRIRLR